MSNTKTSPVNGQEKVTPISEVKPQQKSANAQQTQDLEKRIEAADSLSRKVKARAIFKYKLEQTEEAIKKVKSAGGDEWENSDEFKVTLGDQHDRNKILTFSQKGLIADFLEFITGRITEKIAAIDQEILNTKI